MKMPTHGPRKDIWFDAIRYDLEGPHVSSREEWQWVAVGSQGLNKDAQTRKTVRQNAMKAFRRNERLERLRKYKEARIITNSTSKYRDIQPNPGLDLLGISTGKATSHILTPLASSTILSNREAQRLWFHFVNHIAVQLQPVGIRKECNVITTCLIPQALQHPGFTTSILCHAGSHLDALLNRPWTRSTLFYRGELVRYIKDYLSLGKSEPHDSLLSMVSFLANESNGM